MRVGHKRRLAMAAAAAMVFVAAPAHADPITAAIATFGLALSGGLGTASAIIAYAALAVGEIGLSAASNALFGPKLSSSASQDRQADLLSLTLGEVAREMVVGRSATGGSLIDCAYYGGKYGTDWNIFAVALADHECEGIEGFYVNDTYVPWPFGPGNAGGAVPGYNGQLEVHFRPGRFDDAAGPGEYPTHIPALAQGALKGVCHVAYAYAADAPDAKTPIWSGRPSFLWVLKGAKIYDPRLDDTVQGGAGPQRWSNPDTWTWSENASLCEYAYQRGVYALHQVDQPGMLLVGRGLSDVEAPPERVIAAANLCDELVDAPGGGTEPRYRVGGVIKASDTFQAVAQMFADATAGVVTQPEGGVFVEPGQAKTPVATITDDDLLVGQSIKVQGFASDSDRVNTVIATYVEPTQKWAQTTAPVSREQADLVADGGPRELPLSLLLVPFVGQAQRVSDIRRRKARLERTAGFVLGPRFAHLEEGDWVGWTSQRRWAGATVYFRITAYGLDQAWRNTLALEEIDYAVFGFGGMGADPTGPEPVSPPGALELDGVNIVATHLQGTSTTDAAAVPIVPAVEGTWSTPVDPAISTVRLEVRLGSDGSTTPTSTTNVNKGDIITSSGVVANRTDVEARLVPLGDPSRPVTPSPWVTLSTGDLIASSAATLGGQDINDILATIAATNAAAAAATKAAADLTAQVLGIASANDDAAYGALLGVLNDDQVEKYAKDNTVDTKTLRSSVTAMVVVDGTTGAWSIQQNKVVDQNGQSLSYNLQVLGSNTANNLANAVSLLETKTDAVSSTAQQTTALTAAYQSYVSSATSTLITTASAQGLIAASNVTLTTNYQNYVASATQSFVTGSTMTSSISAATTNLVSQNQLTGAISTATAGMVTQTTLTQTLANYNFGANSNFTGAVANATSSFTTLSTVNSAVATGVQNYDASLPGGVKASVSSSAAAIANAGGLQAFLQIAASTPAGQALVRLLSASTGTEVLLDAAKIYFGSNVDVETATGTMHFFNNSVELIIGRPFGANGDLLLWFGPAGTGTSNCTQGNAYVFLSTNRTLGGTGVPTGGGGGTTGFERIGNPTVYITTSGSVIYTGPTSTGPGYWTVITSTSTAQSGSASGGMVGFVGSTQVFNGGFSPGEAAPGGGNIPNVNANCSRFYVAAGGQFTIQANANVATHFALGLDIAFSPYA